MNSLDVGRRSPSNARFKMAAIRIRTLKVTLDEAMQPKPRKVQNLDDQRLLEDPRVPKVKSDFAIGSWAGLHSPPGHDARGSNKYKL